MKFNPGHPLAASDESLADSATERPSSLEILLSAARRNEAALRRFQALELQLMTVDELEALLDLLLLKVPQTMQWDAVSLHLCDPDREVREMLAGVTFPGSVLDNLHWLEQETSLTALFAGHAPCPRLGPYLPERHGGLFNAAVTPPASVALLPLRRARRWLGVYNVGSRDPARFHPALATDFLDHLTAVAAICLETALHREQLRRLGLTDALTAVGNRRYFDQRLHEELARAQRSSTPLSCLFVDVDHFKRINDSHGHAAGDEVLQVLAQRIRAELRGADVVARHGGEEFAVLLPQADAARAVEVAERIRRCIAGAPFSYAGATAGLNVSASVGVATYRGNAGRLDELGTRLLADADAALYRAKHSGRNRVLCAR